jgi:hypothetical protein
MAQGAKGIPALAVVLLALTALSQAAELTIHFARSKNISTRGPRNRRSLRSGRDDKEGVTAP